MSRFGRWRRRPGETAEREQASLPCGGICWIMQPASIDPIAPARWSLTTGLLHLDSHGASASQRSRHRIEQLAQIDIWVSDVDLLLREVSGELVLVTVRFADDNAAADFVACLTRRYLHQVGSAFPLDRTMDHGARRGNP